MHLSGHVILRAGPDSRIIPWLRGKYDRAGGGPVYEKSDGIYREYQSVRLLPKLYRAHDGSAWLLGGGEDSVFLLNSDVASNGIPTEGWEMFDEESRQVIRDPVSYTHLTLPTKA